MYVLQIGHRFCIFHCKSIIGKLNYLGESSRPNIVLTVHKCEGFAHNIKDSHTMAVINLVKYLKGTKDKGIILKPNQMKSLECYVDADFCGNWNKITAQHYVSTAIAWCSKLQIQIALSTTKAEYIVLSTAMKEVIHIINILNELKERKFIAIDSKADFHCKDFEDNSEELEMARTPKMRPRTKHINILYHWFLEHV